MLRHTAPQIHPERGIPRRALLKARAAAGEDGGVHTMSMSVGNDAEGSIFESSLIHRGKGAPLPERSLGNSRSASGSKQLPGFDMPENGSSMSTAVRIQSAALHYYGGKNAIRIPLSDKKAQLAHHA